MFPDGGGTLLCRPFARAPPVTRRRCTASVGHCADDFFFCFICVVVASRGGGGGGCHESWSSVQVPRVWGGGGARRPITLQSIIGTSQCTHMARRRSRSAKAAGAEQPPPYTPRRVPVGDRGSPGPAGVVSAVAEPSSRCTRAVLDVAGCTVCASAAPSSWCTGGCAGCCGGRLTGLRPQVVHNVPRCVSVCVRPRCPPPPLCDIPSGCCFFTGPWTVTRSSLRMLRRVAAFCRPLRPVLLLVSFPRSRSPVVGVPGLC